MGCLQQVRGISRMFCAPDKKGAIPGNGKTLQDKKTGPESWQRWLPCLELGATAQSVHWPSESLANIQPWFWIWQPRECAELSLSHLLASWGGCSVFSPQLPYNTSHLSPVFPSPAEVQEHLLLCADPHFCTAAKSYPWHTLFHLIA